MTKRDVRATGKIGLFAAIRQRWALFLILALSAFAGASTAANFLLRPSGIDMTLRTEIIDLAVDAENPASLIKAVPLDVDRLRDRISAGPSMPIETLEALPLESGNGEGYDHFLIRLPANDEQAVDDRRAEIDRLLEPVTAFVERENERRSAQREDAAAWFDQRIEAHHAQIAAAKEVILKSPLEPAPASSEAGSDGEALLRLFIDATAQARASDDPGHSDASRSSIDTSLDKDLARLASALSGLGTENATLIEYGTALRNAEDGLAELEGEARRLMDTGGVFDRPAAEIVESALPAPATALSPAWATPLLAHAEKRWVLWPLLAALCLLIAAIGVLIIAHLRPSPVIAADDYLDDPHWPLPEGAHRDLS